MYLLAVVAIAIVVVAILEIGPPTSSARTSKEIVTAENGVVQSTVTGTGNVAAGTDLDVNFKTSGTLQHVYVSQGQHVTDGQLLATLDPTSAQLGVDQAEEQLTSAQDQLTAVENGTATGSGSGGSGTTGGSSTTASLNDVSTSPEFVSYTPPSGKYPKGSVPGKTKKPSSGSSGKSGSSGGSKSKSSKGSSGETGNGSTGSSGSSREGSGGSSRGGTSSTTTQTTTTPSPSSIASAEASVFSAQANLNSAQAALNDTKLFAPASGTIASMASLLPGDSVSAGSSSSASSSSSSSSSSSGGGGLAGGSSTAGSLGSSSSSGSGSSSPFAEIVNTGTLTMTVAFSESDISKIKTGQAATVTFDALPSVELGAHVTRISNVGTSSSGVVSYNATITLDQHDSQVRPGMSASAQVIISQAQGVTVPNAAVTGTGSLGTVNVMNKGKTSTQQVVVGVRGDSRTQIISGLRAGQQLVITITLPAVSSATSSPTGGSGSGTLGGAGAGLGGGGFPGGGGGGFFLRRAAGGGG